MTKEPRKPSPREIELTVLDRSRRRCALCFHLKGDLTEKLGQIAHLDDNPGNSAEDNLVFLCMDHHSLYDSTTSQHKNYTIQEVKAARNRLYQAIEEDPHIQGGLSVVTGRETDRMALADLMQLMTDTGTMRFLRDANFAGWSFGVHETDGLERFMQNSKGAEHEFIDIELEAFRQRLLEAGETFLQFFAVNTFPTLHTPSYRAISQEWEIEQPERFDKAVKELRTAADKLCAAYDELVRAARRKLAA